MRLSEMTWSRSTSSGAGDVLSAHIVGSGNYYEFACRGDSVETFRVRTRYGRRRFGNWSNWTAPDRCDNPAFWAAVRARLADFRAAEAEWTTYADTVHPFSSEAFENEF